MYFLAFAVSLFSLLSALSPGLAQALKPSPNRNSERWVSPFVTAQGTRLTFNGQDFKFVGTNAYWLPYLNSDADIQATLANISKAGITVVRTWAFNDVTEIPQTGSWLQLFQNGTSQFNTGANGIQKLDKFIQFAKMAKIFVYFSLTNNWFPSINQVNPNPSPRNFLSNDYGGMDLYVQEFGVNKTHDEFYTDLNIRAQFNKFVQFIVTRYCNEPTVMAWELANDPRCNSSVAASASCNTNTITQWHADESSFIKSIDSNHLVTSGNGGFFCPNCPKLFPLGPPSRPPSTSSLLPSPPFSPRPRAVAFNGVFGIDSQDILNAPHIDFGTFQLFPDQNNYGTTGVQNPGPRGDFNATLAQSTAFINLHVQSALAVGKPVIATGFGLVTQDNLPAFVPFNSVFKAHQALCEGDGDDDSDDNGNCGGSDLDRRQVATLNTGTSQAQINSAYTTWLQTGLTSGVSGMSQYQFSAQNLVPGTGTFVQGPAGVPGQSPNDGYSIAGADTSGVQTTLTDVSQNLT